MANNGNLIVVPGSEPDYSAFTQDIEIPDMGPLAQKMFDFGTTRVIGQDRAWRRLAGAFSNYNSGLRLSTRQPIVNALFLGPTGTGKTMTVEELARYLINPDAASPPLTRIACSKFKQSHEVANLIGSPPGYKGSDGIPILAQSRIDSYSFWFKLRQNKDALKAYQRAQGKNKDQLDGLVAELYLETRPHISVVLWDEIEKAHPDIWNLVLNIMSDGELTMSGGDGSITDFSNSIHIFTGNVGGREQQARMKKKKVGINVRTDRDDTESQQTDQELYDLTKEKAEEVFPPEFLGRVRDEIIVFRALERNDVRRAIANRYRVVQERLNERPGGAPIVHFHPDFIEYLVDVGYDRTYGMRPLDQAFKSRVVKPLSTLLESDLVRPGEELLMTVAGAQEGKKDRRRTAIRRRPVV